MEPNRKPLSLRGLSIQQRLPLLICILLLSVVAAVGIASYIGVKKASLRIASERLRTVTEQLSSIFGQTAQVAMYSAHNVASEEPVKNFLLSGGTGADSSAITSIRKLQTDSQSLYVELVNLDGKQVARFGRPEIRIRIDNKSILTDLQVEPDSSKVTKMYHVGDSLFYAIVATVTNNKQTIGYLLRWRLIFATSQGMAQFSELLGADAEIYVGNTDGTAWSDLIKAVKSPPADISDTGKYFSYSRPHRGEVIAMARPVAHTQWTLLLEFSQRKIQESAKEFAAWILLIGGIITIIGIIIAWIVSRNITKPLKNLSAAATSIAGGNYTASVEVNRADELGELARSFNTMAVQIKNSQENLEQKVKERTAQLEAANNELEAFSYSVSHDLRAPLRAIGGYAIMLKEDYGERLDAEAARITNTIMTNAKMMGQLIDDLIEFSKIGSKSIAHQKVDMRKLAELSVEELFKQEPLSKYYDIQIDNLPACSGDHNLLKQVWLNLIGNAIKYSSQQAKPRIEIGGHEDNKASHYFIRDNGVGFDMQYAHKLFGVFQRLHTDTVFKGTGIGLALVKRIINRHNGDIRAEAEPGKGAAFYFHIPKINNHG